MFKNYIEAKGRSFCLPTLFFEWIFRISCVCMCMCNFGRNIVY